jgi:serine protease AprX
MGQSVLMVLRHAARSLVVWLSLTAFAASALADNSKISSDLQPLLTNPSAKLNVIVQYNRPPQTCTSGGLLGNLLCTAVNLLGGVLKTVFVLLNAVSATLTSSDIIALSNQSDVDYISLDRPVTATLDYTAAAVNAPMEWSSGYDGSGIGIAVVDSGIYNHPDLLNKWGTGSRVVSR